MRNLQANDSEFQAELRHSKDIISTWTNVLIHEMGIRDDDEVDPLAAAFKDELQEWRSKFLQHKRFEKRNGKESGSAPSKIKLTRDSCNDLTIF